MKFKTNKLYQNKIITLSVILIITILSYDFIVNFYRFLNLFSNFNLYKWYSIPIIYISIFILILVAYEICILIFFIYYNSKNRFTDSNINYYNNFINFNKKAINILLEKFLKDKNILLIIYFVLIFKLSNSLAYFSNYEAFKLENPDYYTSEFNTFKNLKNRYFKIEDFNSIKHYKNELSFKEDRDGIDNFYELNIKKYYFSGAAKFDGYIPNLTTESNLDLSDCLISKFKEVTLYVFLNFYLILTFLNIIYYSVFNKEEEYY